MVCSSPCFPRHPLSKYNTLWVSCLCCLMRCYCANALMCVCVYARPLLEVASSCGLSPLSTLTAREGSTLVLGRFDQVGAAAVAAAAASNAIEIADGEDALGTKR